MSALCPLYVSNSIPTLINSWLGIAPLPNSLVTQSYICFCFHCGQTNTALTDIWDDFRFKQCVQMTRIFPLVFFHVLIITVCFSEEFDFTFKYMLCIYPLSQMFAGIKYSVTLLNRTVFLQVKSLSNYYESRC